MVIICVVLVAVNNKYKQNEVSVFLISYNKIRLFCSFLFFHKKKPTFVDIVSRTQSNIKRYYYFPTNSIINSQF